MSNTLKKKWQVYVQLGLLIVRLLTQYWKRSVLPRSASSEIENELTNVRAELRKKKMELAKTRTPQSRS